jgi:hypothetical protein
MHKDMGCFLLSFALRITRADSCLNLCATELRVGAAPLKMRSFLAVQRHQLMMTMMSLKKGTHS